MPVATCDERQTATSDPCTLPFTHQGDHLTAHGEAWPRIHAPAVRCTRCGAEAVDPGPIGHVETATGSGFTWWACRPECT